MEKRRLQGVTVNGMIAMGLPFKSDCFIFYYFSKITFYFILLF